jgi:membrane peptidoglycan carboxypeptidase
MRRRGIGRWGKLALAGMLAGALVALVALPGTALAGLVAQRSALAYDDLPSDLRTSAPPQTSRLYASDGKTLITTFAEENRTSVPISQVAKVMQQAIVAAEDTRFYEHHGVDIKGLVRAFVADSGSGQAQQGASTLTMQYVRNVLKSDPDATEQQRADATQDSAGRKLQEIRYAVALEKKLTKEQILERYLNIAYFGAGAYGVQAAAETYFGKPASDLTLAEAALLAGLVQSPDTDSPINGDQQAALQRRSYVLDSMVGMKVLAAEAATAAKAAPIGLHPTTQPSGCVQATTNSWGFFCDYFVQWWENQAQFGGSVTDRLNTLRRGGYSIVTTLDPTVQASAVTQSLSVYGYDNAKALPIAVVQPGTGKILAMAVNRHYSLAGNPSGQNGYPNTVNQLVAGGGDITGYQAGSTFKMFTMLAALEAGMPLSTSFNAPSPLPTKWRDSGPGNCGGYWCPVNDNPSWMNGQRTMWSGFGRSVNTYFVWLEEQVGPQKAVEMAQRLGITFRAQSDANLAAKSASDWGAFTLGVANTTPLDLAEAYATIAAQGTYCAPLPVASVTDASGTASPVGPQCKQAIDPEIARAATDAARCPVGQQGAFGQCDGGTGTVAGSLFGNRPVAGKTGSAENHATETFVGFTPQMAAAGIAAVPSDATKTVGSAVESQVVRAVASTLLTAVRNLPVVQFTAPSATSAFGPSGQPPATQPPAAPTQTQPATPTIKPPTKHHRG